ncbi:uncharacterized [Tachysurus ichikawai]
MARGHAEVGSHFKLENRAPEFLLSSCEMCLLVVDGVLITSTVWTWSCSAVLRCCESTWLHVALKPVDMKVLCGISGSSTNTGCDCDGHPGYGYIWSSTSTGLKLGSQKATTLPPPCFPQTADRK